MLGATHGFYGLVAAGWDIGDTTGKGTRGPLPDDTIAIEQMVGMLDAERASETAANVWSASEFNEYAAAAFATSHGRTPPVALTDDQLGRIRSTRDALHQRWFLLTPDTNMELPFPVPSTQN